MSLCLALTLPVTLIRAMGQLASHHVLVTDSNALLALARVDCAVFDKTGRSKARSASACTRVRAR